MDSQRPPASRPARTVSHPSQARRRAAPVGIPPAVPSGADLTPPTARTAAPIPSCLKGTILLGVSMTLARAASRSLLLSGNRLVYTVARKRGGLGANRPDCGLHHPLSERCTCALGPPGRRVRPTPLPLRPPSTPRAPRGPRSRAAPHMRRGPLEAPVGPAQLPRPHPLGRRLRSAAHAPWNPGGG